MAAQEIEHREFTFPHEGQSDEVYPLEIEGALNSNDDVLSDENEEEIQEVVTPDDDGIEVDDEVINDVPPEDRDRLPSNPPEDVTEEELNQYTSKKTQDRIKHFAKSFHDERRKAEAAQRKANELTAYAKAVLAENEQLKGSVHQGRSTLIDQAKKAVAAELAQAEREFTEAYSTGEPAQVLEAQRKLTAASIKKDKLDNFKMPALQKPTDEVQVNAGTASTNWPDPKVTAWRERNPWYGPDTVMTATALGLNRKLIDEEGHDGQSDEYYAALDSGLRKLFPDKFKAPPVQDKEKTPTSVVAPVARSTPPKKIRLTETQVAIARELGISNKGYAAQVAKLNRGTK